MIEFDFAFEYKLKRSNTESGEVQLQVESDDVVIGKKFYKDKETGFIRMDMTLGYEEEGIILSAIEPKDINSFNSIWERLERWNRDDKHWIVKLSKENLYPSSNEEALLIEAIEVKDDDPQYAFSTKLVFKVYEISKY